MSNILDPAKRFFEACETGKGWDEEFWGRTSVSN